MKRVIDLIKVPLRPFYTPVKKYISYLIKYWDVKKLDFIDKGVVKRIFYFGITTHNNLGDNAQFYCIRNWIKVNYPNVPSYEFTAPAIVHPKLKFVEKMKKILKPDDIIIFQSGYTTQDLGGVHEEMHRLIIDNIPNANILMMPQTIFFQHKKNEIICSKSYNQAKNMLFLARDNVSNKKAVEMFPDIAVKCFPDIVTTLIGQYSYNNKREGILLCRRNDLEKLYPESELMDLKNRMEDNLHQKVTVSDTSIKMKTKKLHKNLQQVLEDEFESYSKYRMLITDRYHGTIFSLIAGTPVIVIKTTDHKVTTGADWFKGVYDDYVFLAKDLDDAYSLAEELLRKEFTHKMEPYFNLKYYNKLKTYFNKVIDGDL